MNINGFQDFINKFGNDNIASINTLKDCVTAVSKICNCQKQRKSAKVEECNNLYISIVNSKIVNMIEYLKTKTEDSEIVFYYNGSHEIKRFKLH